MRVTQSIFIYTIYLTELTYVQYFDTFYAIHFSMNILPLCCFFSAKMNYVHVVIEIFTLSSQIHQTFFQFISLWVLCEIGRFKNWKNCSIYQDPSREVYCYFQIKKNFICVLEQRHKTNWITTVLQPRNYFNLELFILSLLPS